MKNIRDKITSWRKDTREATHGFLLAHPRIARTYLKSRQTKRRLAEWWKMMDKRHAWWRAANITAVAVLVVSSFTPLIGDILAQRAYALSDSSRKLVGEANSSLANQLIYNPAEKTYLFNVTAQKSTEDNPAAALQAQIGASTGKSDDKSLYSLDVSQRFRDGVKYHDVNSGLEFTMQPQFAGMDGQIVDSHLVFPIGGGKQAIYTLKGNGLKEDIVVPQVKSDALEFSYQLKLPKTLEAKMIEGGNGAVGIYSADPSLYGNMQYASGSDRAAVEKLRETADKNYLVFGLPAPVTKDLSGNIVGQSKFTLEGEVLKVEVDGLTGTKGPITVDPSVVVTSASDFSDGNGDSNIDFTTAGQIARGGLTGGDIGAWSAVNTFTGGREHAMSTTYNGYLYVASGNNRTTSTTYGDTQYAKINSDGTLGAWTVNTSLPPDYLKTPSGLVAYNGYLYLIGGESTTTFHSDVAFAKINADGSLGQWSSTTNMPLFLADFGSVATGGYMYVVGGSPTNGGSCGTNNDCQDTVYYAPINGDGTVGAWQTTASFAQARALEGVLAYNGYIYIVGGGNTGYLNDVQYAKINTDGTLSSWTATSSFTNVRYGAAVYAYGGYIYLAGGVGGSALTDTQYAQINANGSIGAWTTSLATLPQQRIYPSYASYNGYLYLLGGYDKTTDYSNVLYAKIRPAGYTTAFSTASNNFTTAVALACSVTYNGYIYKIGGSTTDGSTNLVNSVQYAPLNTTTGNIGTWAATTVLPAATGSAGCAAFNGKLYVVGGDGNGKNVRSATINSDGTVGAWTLVSNNGFLYDVAKPGVIIRTAANGNTYMYVIGGCSYGNRGNVQCDFVYYATVNSDGTLGVFSNTSAMIATYTGRAYAQVGGYVYAIGGEATSGIKGDVEYAAINADGTLGAWTAMATATTETSSWTTATVVNGCIYILGGEKASNTNTTTNEYTCPNADGTISSWTNLPTLSTATTDMGVTSYNGYIYGVGGWTSSARNTSFYARVNNGGAGSVNAWAPTTSLTGTTRGAHASVVYNGYLYLIGGVASYIGDFNDVQYAKINSDGTLGTWSTTTSFTTARDSHTAVVYNGYMYILGGKSGTALNDVQYAKINSDGTVGSWATTNSFTTARYNHASVVYNGYIYVMGGYTGSTYLNDVQYAKINSDGTVGSWTATNSFATGRYGQAASIYNGYLYLSGGYTGSTYLNDVQYAKINSDGTIGLWTATNSFATGREYHTMVMYNGFMYIIGGTMSGAFGVLSDVQYAPIGANGALGSWSTTSSFATARDLHSSAAYNGYVYILGGSSTSSTLSDVQYASLNSISRSAKYSKLIDLGSANKITGISVNGSLANPLQNVSYRLAGGDGVFGTTHTVNDLSAGSASFCGDATNLARYIWLSVNIDDSASGIFSDTGGSNVTDMTVNYTSIHPAPHIRLRGGKTLQQSVGIAQFDTCAQ